LSIWGDVGTWQGAGAAVSDKRRLIRALRAGASQPIVEALRANGWLSDGSLRGARLPDVRLDGLNLAGAYLPEANLKRASLRGADLSRARLPYATLFRAVFDGANLEGANLHHAQAGQATFVEVDLRWADLSEAYLERANLRGARLDEAALGGANLRGAGLSVAQARTVGTLRGVIMPHGARYDGRFNLPGDIEAARLAGIDPDDEAAMADWYGVPINTYRSGRAGVAGA
jgi:uncharacterized protein YjbI with pentapeptide repeats